MEERRYRQNLGEYRETSQTKLGALKGKAIIEKILNVTKQP